MGNTKLLTYDMNSKIKYYYWWYKVAKWMLETVFYFNLSITQLAIGTFSKFIGNDECLIWINKNQNINPYWDTKWLTDSTNFTKTSFSSSIRVSNLKQEKTNNFELKTKKTYKLQL